MSVADSHRCIERSTDCDCPICGEYMFTSPRTVVFMPCGHSIHQKCYYEHMKSSYKCPICNRSVVNMETQFRNLDRTIAAQPMPAQYQNMSAVVSCNDCHVKSVVSYHWLGLKCAVCSSYNTAQLQLKNSDEATSSISMAGSTAGTSGNPAATASSSDPQEARGSNPQSRTTNPAVFAESQMQRPVHSLQRQELTPPLSAPPRGTHDAAESEDDYEDEDTEEESFWGGERRVPQVQTESRTVAQTVTAQQMPPSRLNVFLHVSDDHLNLDDDDEDDEEEINIFGHP
jgi:hypothetical protein